MEVIVLPAHHHLQRVVQIGKGDRSRHLDRSPDFGFDPVEDYAQLGSADQPRGRLPAAYSASLGRRAWGRGYPQIGSPKSVRFTVSHALSTKRSGICLPADETQRLVALPAAHNPRRDRTRNLARCRLRSPFPISPRHTAGGDGLGGLSPPQVRPRRQPLSAKDAALSNSIKFLRRCRETSSRRRSYRDSHRAG